MLRRHLLSTLLAVPLVGLLAIGPAHSDPDDDDDYDRDDPDNDQEDDCCCDNKPWYDHSTSDVNAWHPPTREPYPPG